MTINSRQGHPQGIFSTFRRHHMNQNLVSIEFSPAELDAIDGALAVLEAKLDRLIVLDKNAERKEAERNQK